MTGIVTTLTWAVSLILPGSRCHLGVILGCCLKPGTTGLLVRRQWLDNASVSSGRPVGVLLESSCACDQGNPDCSLRCCLSESLLKLTLLMLFTLFEAMCLVAGTERIDARSVKSDYGPRTAELAPLVDCSPSTRTGLGSYTFAGIAPVKGRGPGSPHERHLHRESSRHQVESRSAGTVKLAGFSELRSPFQHQPFLTCLRDRCVEDVSRVVPRVFARWALKTGGITLLAILISVSGLYALQSDIVPNLVLYKLYRAENTRATQAAGSSKAVHSSTELAPSKKLVSDHSAPVSGELYSIEDDVHTDACWDTSRTHSLEKLATLLAWHSSSSDWKRAAARKLLGAVILADHSDSNSTSFSEAVPPPRENATPNRHIGSEEKDGGRHGVKMSCINGFTGDQCSLDAFCPQWRDDIPWTLKLLFRWHAVAKHFEFLPLLLLVCGCASCNLAVFVALHLYVCEFSVHKWK